MSGGAMIHPEDRGHAAEAVAEAVDDLSTLLAHVQERFEHGDEYMAVVVELTRGLLVEPRWGRIELASVLAVAVADLAKGPTR